MREIDRLTTERYGTPPLMLMEAAATAVARVVTERLSGDVAGKSVLVLCGRGNNGGDGAGAARLLALAGARVSLVLSGKVEGTRGEARTNFDAAHGLAVDEPARGGQFKFSECESNEEWHNFLSQLSESPDVIIDALFGTGLTRPVEGVSREAVQFLRKLRASRSADESARPLIVSIDLPSGLNSDIGELIGEAVHADVTITMTAPKPANILPPAAHYNGDLIVADIGSPVELIDEAKSQLFVTEGSDARRWLVQTRYSPESYKTTHGHALIIAGSRGFTGAAALCGNAAMRAGAGLVTVATPASTQSLVVTQLMPEVMTAALAETDRGAVSDEAANYVLKFAARANVIAIGPGLSSDKSALHDRVAAARAFATAHAVVLLLKGSRPLIAAPDGLVFVNPTGNAGLGTAGAGDTLTGIVAGFLAQAYGNPGQGADAVSTVIAALYISGLAGDLAASELGMRTMTASDIRKHLSPAICLLDCEGELPPGINPGSISREGS